MTYSQAWLINEMLCHKNSTMRCADRRLDCISIGPKRHIVFDWPIHQRLIDHFSRKPLEVTILQFLLVACMWVVSDDQSIRCPNELGNSFENTLIVSTPSAYDWVTGVETCEKAVHQLYHRLRIISLVLYNLSVSYAWYLYSSNSSSMYFFLKQED